TCRPVTNGSLQRPGLPTGAAKSCAPRSGPRTQDFSLELFLKYGGRTMPRFLHTADWQIGRQYARFAPEDALALAEARLSAVERLADIAHQEAVDAVLVAGDVFDAQT